MSSVVHHWRSLVWVSSVWILRSTLWQSKDHFKLGDGNDLMTDWYTRKVLGETHGTNLPIYGRRDSGWTEESAVSPPSSSHLPLEWMTRVVRVDIEEYTRWWWPQWTGSWTVHWRRCERFKSIVQPKRAIGAKKVSERTPWILSITVFEDQEDPSTDTHTVCWLVLPSLPSSIAVRRGKRRKREVIVYTAGRVTTGNLWGR